MVKPAPFQGTVKSGEVARVEPNKKWFGECTEKTPIEHNQLLLLLLSHVILLNNGIFCRVYVHNV